MTPLDDILGRNPLEVLVDAGVQHLGQRLGVPLLARPRPASHEVLEGEVIDNPAPKRTKRKRIQLPPGEGDVAELFDRIGARPAGVYLILGPREAGKTGFLLRFTEQLGRPRFALGPIGGGLGREYHAVTRDVVRIRLEDLAAVPPRSTILFDDMSTLTAANSRDYTSAAAQRVQDEIHTCRHRGITFVGTDQDTASLNKYFGAEPDASFWKPPKASTRALGYMAERPGVERTLERIREQFDQVPRSEWVHLVYCIADDYTGFIDYDYPRGM